MAEHANTARQGRATSSSSSKVYRSATSGRIVSRGERIAAARTRVLTDQRRGRTTESWIVELAKQSD